MAQRDYIVLRRYEGANDYWDELGIKRAYSSAAARKAAAAEINDGELEAGVRLVAVSATQWRNGCGELKSKTETRIVPA